MTGSQVSGVGICVPQKVLMSSELEADLDLDEDWIVHRTGISSRRIASDDETASSLGTIAGARALAAAGIHPSDLDLIVCATVTPDWRFPATACLIGSALGAGAPAFDLNAGCSGFLFALAQADAAVRSGSASRVLVVGCEVLSRITDYTDPKTAILFGDGAGAVVVEKCDQGSRLGPFSLFSDGSRPQLLYVPEETGRIRMQGREVYRAAVEGMNSSVAGLLHSCGLTAEDVDLVIAHQANKRILDAVASRLGLTNDKLFSNIGEFGNTSSASIPIALHAAQEMHPLEDGDLVVLTAFGAGFSWGAGLVRWGTRPLEARTLVAAGDANV